MCNFKSKGGELIMKTLKIFKADNEYRIHRINQFGTVFKRSFITEEGLKEGIDAYQPVLHEYQIEATTDVWALVLNHLSKGGR